MSEGYRDKLLNIKMSEKLGGWYRKKQKINGIQDRKLVTVLVIIILFQIMGALLLVFKSRNII